MKKLRYLCCAFIVFIIGVSFVNAASDYKISLSATSVSKGRSVTLYVKGNNLTGGFVVSSSNSSVAAVSNSSVWIENNTETVKINTIRAGSATITVKPTTVSDDSGNDLSLGAKTINLVVSDGGNSNNSSSGNSKTEEVKKSNDANLKSLSIDGIDITPAFKSDVLEYKALAKAGTNKIKINASANDDKANVSGIGEVSVSDGMNKLEVIVAAEDGTTKVYVIELNVEEFKPIEVKIGNKKYTVVRKKDDLPDIELFEDKKIKIGNEEVDGYYNEKLKIYLVGLKDDKGNIQMYVYEPDDNSYKIYKWVNVGGVTLYINKPKRKLEFFKKYSTIIKNTKVDIYKLSKKEDIGLLYGTNVSTGNKGYYVYDEEEATLARYYNSVSDLIRKKYDNNSIIMVIMGVASGLLIVGIIVSMVLNKKKRKRTRR